MVVSKSWIGLVGFHLGPKLKRLDEIRIQGVNVSSTKLEFYKFWGAFNRAWRPSATPKIVVEDFTATHINQLTRLAFVTKVEELEVYFLESPSKQVEPAPPVPVMPSGISFPLRRLFVHGWSLDLALSMPWHTLARQCPSLSDVEIRAPKPFPIPFTDCRLFLVSIFDMFRVMQRRNDTNYVTVGMVEMEAGQWDPPDNAGSTTPDARPRLHRGLNIDLTDMYMKMSPMESSAYLLTCFEDAMVPGANNVNQGFHQITIYTKSYFLTPDSCQPLDAALSRLRVTTPDVHIVINDPDQPRQGCVLPWAGERFPMFTELVPNAFCDLEAGRPCKSHPKQVSPDERERAMETGEQEGMAGTAAEVEQDVGMETEEGMETEAGSGSEVEMGAQEEEKLTENTAEAKARARAEQQEKK